MKEKIKENIQTVSDALKDMEGVYLCDIRDFVNGQVTVNKKGILKLPLALNAEDVLQNPDSVEDVIEGNWKMIPLILFVKEKA